MGRDLNYNDNSTEYLIIHIFLVLSLSHIQPLVIPWTDCSTQASITTTEKTTMG